MSNCRHGGAGGLVCVFCAAERLSTSTSGTNAPATPAAVPAVPAAPQGDRPVHVYADSGRGRSAYDVVLYGLWNSLDEDPRALPLGMFFSAEDASLCARALNRSLQVQGKPTVTMSIRKVTVARARWNWP